MNVEIEEFPNLRVATVRHAGPYDEIAEAFERLGALAGPAGLTNTTHATLVAIYHDDPRTTAADKLRSDAGIVVPPTAELPEGLGEERIQAGRYARVEHVGPYDELAGVWTRFVGKWLAESGYRAGSGPTFEVYRNTPANARAEDLVTHLYVPVA